jgi:lipopolysaccharide transport system ATP-binding protein
MTDVAIHVQDLSKRFKLYGNPWDRVLEWVSGGRLVRHDDFWALRDVSFTVRRGECLGVIGVNGAGKTTLLKILSGALWPTGGVFRVHGRLASLLELGTGFNPELTGRANVFQSARLLGFSRADVQDRLRAILDFADVGDFIDQPVKRYSSGMFVRLAFALFAHLEPDVYIVDEALAVGDIFFQQKCFRRLRELRRQGCTILLVSHDMEAVTHLCDRAILLSGGKLTAEGDPPSVVHDYFALMGQRFMAGTAETDRAVQLPAGAASPSALDVPEPVRAQLQQPLTSAAHAESGGGAATIVGFAVTDAEGRPSWAVASGGSLRFWYLAEARSAIADLNVGIHFYDRRGILVFAVGTANLGHALPALAPGERLLCTMSVTLELQPGEYTLLPQVGGLTGGSPEPGVLHDRLQGLPPVLVTARPGPVTPFYGLVNLPVQVAWTTEV